MFTGLVQSIGTVTELVATSPGARLTIREAQVAADAVIGDSIAINGCCLTVVEIDGPRLTFEAGEETLSRTNLGGLHPKDGVNLEASLKAGDSLGGHFVTGHIDGVAALQRRLNDGPWCTMWFEPPQELLRQMARKGSVAVDGVSLTLVDVTADAFSVALIPHTLEHTTLGRRQVGDLVNLETDVLAKYVERQLQGLHAFPPAPHSGL